MHASLSSSTRRRRAVVALAAAGLLAVPIAGVAASSTGADAAPAATASVTGVDQVTALYRVLLGRAPEPGGHAYWTTQQSRGVPVSALAGEFLRSAEFRARHGNLDNAGLVDFLYRAALGRAGEPAGRAYWIDQLNRGLPRTTVAVEFVASAEYAILTGHTPARSIAAPTAPPPAPAGQVLLSANFDGPNRGFGSVDRNVMAGLLGRSTWCSSPQELAIADGTLRVRLAPSSVGTARAFCYTDLPAGHDEVWLRYRVYAEPGWVPVRGGKLAGLAGGAANTGGNPPTRGEGFSARNMWREGGRLVQYTYHQGQSGKYADDFRYDDGVLVAGQWRTIVHRVRMNGHGRADGTITAWVDGRQVLHRDGLVLRGNGHTFGVDKLMLGAFYGGADRTWSPPHTTYLRFDDVVVSTGAL